MISSYTAPRFLGRVPHRMPTRLIRVPQQVHQLGGDNAQGTSAGLRKGVRRKASFEVNTGTVSTKKNAIGRFVTLLRLSEPSFRPNAKA